MLKVAAVALALGFVGLVSPRFAAAQENPPHVRVTGEGIPEEYRAAIAKTIAAARGLCVDRYGFDMPEVIHVAATVNPKSSVRLFNDGADRFSLTVKTERQLQQPSASGVFHIYGLCHEVAHLAMYRPIADHSWLALAGAEGWAHWLGSQLVDAVYEQEGQALWPDPYDYRDDGTRRLNKQLAGREPSDVAQGARLWGQLAEIVGPEKLHEVFAAWGRGDLDPANPQAALEAALAPFGKKEQLAAWWKEAGPLLLVKREQSQFPLTYATRLELAGEPRELALDDGKAAGKKSLAGGGHGVRFDVPDQSWFLTSVRIYGARYGAPQPPRDDFEVFLCDAEMNKIASYKFPYSKFARGKEQWVKLEVRPTNVPSLFVVGVAFHPTATKGVYVSQDADGGGQSVTGLPGRPARDFAAGDWMIRVEVSQSKAADALSDGK